MDKSTGKTTTKEKPVAQKPVQVNNILDVIKNIHSLKVILWTKIFACIH